MRGWGPGVSLATALAVVLAACAPTVTEVFEDEPASGPIEPASSEPADPVAVEETSAVDPGPTDDGVTVQDAIELEPAIPLPGPWELVRVIDGDTLDVRNPDGDTVRVRLIGINAPERGECLYEGAAEALRSITTGGEIVLVPDLSDADRYGRKLRYVEVDGQDAGAALVRLGLAIARGIPPDTLREFTYRGLQDDAQAAGVGRWDEEACGASGSAAPDDVSIEVEVHHDAAGDDEQNLNDEWVRFTNTGGFPVDLEGWTVADASSLHRYTFGRLAIQPDASVTLYTGCGVDSLRERFWCNRDSAVWNNDRDALYLRDALGNDVVVYEYDND